MEDIQVSSDTTPSVWEYVSSLQKLIESTKGVGLKTNELEDKLKFLKLSIQKKKESEINLKDLRKICVDQWKKVIKESITILISRIDNRVTKGSEFSEIKKQLRKLSDDIDFQEFNLMQYQDMYEDDIIGFRDQIKEKIEIEQHNNEMFWKGIIIGFILGIIGSIVFNYLGFI